METILDIFFSALEKESNIPLHRSSIPILIQDQEGQFEGYFAFFRSGAVRAEISGGKIIGVAVWTQPADLNKPEWHFKTRDIDAVAEVDLISKIMHGRAGFTGKVAVHESRLRESAKESVAEFMTLMGEYSHDKKLSDLYSSYEQWAEVNNRKKMSQTYFFQLAKEWLVKGKKGKYKDFEVTKGNPGEKTEVKASEDETFVKDVLNNEIFYKAALFEHTLRQMARNDPKINSLFVCGPAGVGKTYTVKKNP